MTSRPGEASAPRLLVAEPAHFSTIARQLLAESLEVVVDAVPPTELAAAFRDFDAVWIRLGHRVNADNIPEACRCRVLAVPATGLDHVDVGACEKAGIEVVSLRGHTEFLRDVRGTAEHTVGLLLALLRRIPAAHRSVLDGEWPRDLYRGSELYGKTVGVVGLGRLGSQVGRYLRAFGMTVLGYDPRPDFPDDVAVRCDDLQQLLQQSDVITLHVPLDATTRHLLDSDALRALKPGAVVINTSRGGVVDGEALVEALERGNLAGVAVDVLSGEPLIDADPLVRYARSHDNVVITPHIGGNTVESGEKTDLFIARRVLAALGLEGRQA